MARRPTPPARRKRRTAVCAVLLPLLLAALLLVLDVPFLTAKLHIQILHMEVVRIILGV